jgi:hypothetical protein
MEYSSRKAVQVQFCKKARPVRGENILGLLNIGRNKGKQKYRKNNHDEYICICIKKALKCSKLYKIDKKLYQIIISKKKQLLK